VEVGLERRLLLGHRSGVVDQKQDVDIAPRIRGDVLRVDRSGRRCERVERAVRLTRGDEQRERSDGAHVTVCAEHLANPS
jgi:hypothetical protein